MKKKLIALAIAVSALALSSWASAAGPEAGVDLAVGAQRQIAAGRNLQRVAVGDPAVADILIIKGGGGVMLIGKSAGTTNVMLWERGRSEPTVYTVHVTSGAAHALLNDATPRVDTYGDTTVISGSANTLEAHQRAVDVANAAAAARAAAQQSSSAGGGQGKGQAVGSGGGNGGGGGGDSAGPNVVDASTISGRNVVQVDVRVVEFSRSAIKQAGLNLFKSNNGFSFGSFAPSSLQSSSYNPSAGLTVTAVSPITSAFNLVVGSTSRGIAGNLSVLEQNNLARILAQPTLVALSGQSASFLAGGEIPVPVPQSLGTISIEYKPYGIGLTVTPTVLGPNRIALKVAPEASQLDFLNAITINSITVPALTTRRADTTVELGDGESYVIGGLVDRETTSNVSKVPFLGDLPIIGAFFKSLNYQQNDKELVFVVTPHLVSPIAAGASLPSTPGEQSEQRDGPVWRSFLGGILVPDAAPGFSK
ncbi:type II and III secretion system protein family protein [Burkholderia gladioli]|uniref:type II and III secretion system protein family protein n=1 Tax=Burkholderia gladioli TaxID=28095 RepID=UPI001641BCED|nr:type II and III secretion system protein family protein [Burkholderia gladioli]CAG9235607.1 Type II/IV secretion system secretin RcpA/CpaC, associated with Flp pilus assembly [Burkholderia gladioli]